MISSTVVLKPVLTSHHMNNRPPIDIKQIKIWLIANVGVNARHRDLIDGNRPWFANYEWDSMEFSFHREEDATLFTLRWS
jgi:transposase